MPENQPSYEKPRVLMKSHFHLLQIDLHLQDYKFALLCFVTAFVVTMLSIPLIIKLSRKYDLYDMPNERKEHVLPVPTMGGIAVVAGMLAALGLWLPFHYDTPQVCFFFSVAVLLSLGIMDDLRDLSARYKFFIQAALATLMAISGIRITSFEGLFGIYELPLAAQYTFTLLTIAGVTNAFNLIDGIDGLAGGIGFMSLTTLGIFLTMNGDIISALIAFSLAGAVVAFLYFNFNPAKIFLGDTGSLVLGFSIAVLCIRLMQVNTLTSLPHSPLFVLSLVFIPVFDTIRVFAKRIWKGKSPFQADKTHIHHLLTNAGFSHVFATRLICGLHGFILLEVYWLKELRIELILLILIAFMIVVTTVLKNIRVFVKKTSTGFSQSFIEN
ncbi:MAG: undecaprenyl/decaprenyl-phosphate alpha-N-acetylglucosaminyl 1-phosphate transferase [Bacteroidetes bacterium]|nr:MAG: undecaprenyl/decaprenyl-phosphate alpha-N-acetylglucosaminyl 1-phosphate transferase [Bacteroidota bacterium]